MTSDHEFDAVVVGGGPSGSTVATLVARRGHRVALLEKERFPRYQIGESLLPSTVHGVCNLLGVSQEIEDAKFVIKHGGTFRWGTNPKPWSLLFAISPELSGPTSHAYQVERLRFDQILLNNARRHGVEVWEGSRVTRIHTDDGRVSGLTYTDPSGTARRINARFVVDASGNRSAIYKSVGEREYSSFFRNVAVFGYFHDGKRLPQPDAGNILCAAFDEGWIWYIPLNDKLTSVGAVVNRSEASALRGNPAASLAGFIGRCELVRSLLENASRVTTGPYGSVRIRKDYSYINRKFWRPGMALIGDSACFIDPVFSTGVHLGTYAGLLAARSINSVLSKDIPEERAFAEFETRYRHEYAVFAEFLTAFYDMQSNEQSYFWRARKATGLSSSDREAFVTLVGGVASRDAALVGSASGQFTGSAGLAEASARTGVMETESGEPASQRLEPASDDGGLVPTDDELSWVFPT